ncbi:Uncharacterised protein [Mycobacterium tuberculosis]|nr:Uncharacterised protein [Mycobacterium tuberculosis]
MRGGSSLSGLSETVDSPLSSSAMKVMRTRTLPLTLGSKSIDVTLPTAMPR